MTELGLTLYLYCITAFVSTCILVLVAFLFCISYVTSLALWLQDLNKLAYLLNNWSVIPTRAYEMTSTRVELVHRRIECQFGREVINLWYIN